MLHGATIPEPARLQRWAAVRAQAAATLARLASTVTRFDPSEPRDDEGKWTDGGGDGGEAAAANAPAGDAAPSAFISPSTSAGTSLADAHAALSGAWQQAFVAASHDIDQRLGKSGTTASGAIGAWRDGAENSLMLQMSKGWTRDEARAALAMKAWIGDQKQALLFTPSHDGRAYMATFPATGELAKIHANLLAGGLAQHTLEPTAGGAIVHVYGDDQKTADAVDEAAKQNGTQAKFTFGDGEFIGTAKQDGTDREQRDDARRQYEGIIADASARPEFAGRDLAKTWNDVRDRWQSVSHPDAAAGAAGSASGSGGPRGASSPGEAQGAAAQAAAGHAGLSGLPVKPIKVGDGWYVPGPFGKAQDAAAEYMRKAGLPYDPPRTYQKVDKARATRIADEFEKMKHDPADPAVKASYDALAKELLAQWKVVKDTGLKIDWIKPGQPDPYATSLRMAAMDVTQNNHLWVFPTELGFGSGTQGAEEAKNDNPMLQPTGETVAGHAMLVNDVFRIVHDYFGHFKEGVGFRADGEDNAWRSHAAMFTPLARGALTSETRGQNSWLNFGPPAEHNLHATPADTIYAPQKVGLMPEWTANEGRADPPAGAERAAQWAAIRAQAAATLARLVRGFDPGEPRDDQGRWTEGGGDGGGSAGGGAAAPKEPEQLELPGIPPPPPATAKPSGGKTKPEDFEDAEVDLDPNMKRSKERTDKFVEEWDKHVAEPPEKFKEDFAGGLPGDMKISHKYDEYEKGAEPNQNAIEINGTIVQDGHQVATYTRTIDFLEAKASSDYFKIESGYQGKNIGKQLLKANVDTYRKLGLNEVEVHADIDVGGYAWAKYGYVPTDDSIHFLQNAINENIDRLSGGASGTPTSWDEMGERQQDRVRDAWMDATQSDFYDSAVSDWYDSGAALAEAKTQLAGTFDTFSEATSKWAYDGLSGYAITVGEGDDVKGVSVPKFLADKGTSIDAVLANTTIEFNDRHGDGREDPEITIDDTKTPELTDDQRHQIEEMLVEVFNKEAEKRASDVDVPEYVSDNVAETQRDVWDSMRDRDKFAWAESNNLVEPEDGGGEDGEIDGSTADNLRHLVDELDSDPKALWAIADSDYGKDLLISTDWNGYLDLHDKDTMTRFNAYVGKAKPAASASAQAA